MSGTRARPRSPHVGVVLAACALATLGFVRDAAAQVTVRSAVSATRIPLGETVDWVVTVDGAMGADLPEIPDIDFADVQSLGQSQNMSWVNGRSSQRTVFQFRLTPTHEGSFSIPAVRVRAGGRVYTTDAIAVEVTPAQPGDTPTFSTGGGTRLRLVASVDPKLVVVGQPVVLTMRLYQGTRILGEPQYTAPETPRFYVEPTNVGRTYYEGSGSSRWLVGERKTVLYPTVAGRLTIGGARMACLVASFDRPDGFPVELRSEPQSVDVRPLPAGPVRGPVAVADAGLLASVDRATIRQDEALTLTYRLSGTGNLRLAPPPGPGELSDFEVFERTVSDSLDVESGRAAGAKVVRYTLLPRRTGPLEIPGSRYWCYVPGQGYRALDLPAFRVDVTPGLGRGRTQATAAAQLAPTDDPGGSPWPAARPFAGAALLAAALAVWCARVRSTSAAESAREAGDELRASSELATRLARARSRSDGAEFWRSAEVALENIGGDAAGGLRARIAQSRYAPGGGDTRTMDEVATAIDRALGERRRTLERAAAGGRPAWARFATIACAVAALAAAGAGAYVAWNTPGDAELRERLGDAARLLSQNRVPDARAALIELWNAGGRRPGVASDLALAAFFERKLGEAALWTERSRRLDPRHPLAERLISVLEAEGAWRSLPTGARAKTTSGELAFLACVLASIALLVLAFGRARPAARWSGIALVAVAAIVGVMAARGGAEGEAPGRGVILADTPLASAPGGGGDVELEAGRAVWLEGTSAGWTRVRAGSSIHGYVPAARVKEI